MKRILLGTVALLALGTAPALAQQKTIKIGFISSFSGPAAAIGNDMRNSFELALDHHGRKLGGLPVEVIYEDDQIKPEVGVQKTQKLIESDKVDFIVGYIWSNVLLASLKPIVDSKTFLVITNAGAVAGRGRTMLALRVLDLVEQRSDAAGGGPLHEPEGREKRLPDRSELRGGQGHAGRREGDLQGPDRGPGIDPVARPARLFRRAVQGASGKAGCDLRVLSRRRRHPVRHPVRAIRTEGPDSALHRVHHRRAVAAAHEGPRRRHSRRAAMGQRSAERREQEVRRRLQGEVQGFAIVLRRTDL